MMNAKFLLINEDFLQCVFALYLLFMYMYNVDRKDSNFIFFISNWFFKRKEFARV